MSGYLLTATAVPMPEGGVPLENSDPACGSCVCKCFCSIPLCCSALWSCVRPFYGIRFFVASTTWSFCIPIRALKQVISLGGGIILESLPRRTSKSTVVVVDRLCPQGMCQCGGDMCQPIWMLRARGSRIVHPTALMVWIVHGALPVGPHFAPRGVHAHMESKVAARTATGGTVLCEVCRGASARGERAHPECALWLPL